MRLPWIQVDQTAFPRSDELAAVLGISRPQALGHLVMLWNWALGLAEDGSPPSGELVGKLASVRLEAGAGWDGKRGDLFSALVELGLCSGNADALRVHGIARYADVIARQEARTEAAKRAARARWGRGNSELDANALRTQCGTDAIRCQDVDVDVDKEQQAVAASGSGPALVLVEQGPRKPARKPSTQQEFWAWAQRIRSEDGLLPDEQWPIPKINARLASINGHSRQLIADAYLAFVSDERMKAKGAPMAFFAQDWPRWAERVAAESEVSP